MRKVVKNEGFKGLYKGLWISSLGQIPYLGISFLSFDLLKNNLNNEPN